MSKLEVTPIGQVNVNENGMYITVDENYLPALQALDGFSHLDILWWFSDFDTEEARSVLETPKPYKAAPKVMGIFATRSPVRPNPIALTVIEVLDIDYEKGIIRTTYLDANDGSPVLDIKPYTPSADRIEAPLVPSWCSHWPKSFETSGDFDWEDEFIF